MHLTLCTFEYMHKIMNKQNNKKENKVSINDNWLIVINSRKNELKKAFKKFVGKKNFCIFKKKA